MTDAVYGDGSEFREGLRTLKLDYFLQVSPTSHLAWREKPHLNFKQKRHHVAPEQSTPSNLLSIASEIAPDSWTPRQWKAADGSTRRTRLAWQRVFLAHALRGGKGEMEETWLVVDWPEGDASPYHCYLAGSGKRSFGWSSPSWCEVNWLPGSQACRSEEGRRLASRTGGCGYRVHPNGRE